MIVRFKISDGFRYYVPGVEDLIHGKDIEVPEGTTMGELIDMAGLPEDVVVIPLLNGVRSDRTKTLHDQDQLYLLHPAMGG